ncbi:hypothetical protein [Neorhodopirellula lusitana]|uniref:hypothetical protein n=1 Tax=Neorhodopirellula lusitana TaxID=445327 RepID=UPI0038516D96
MFRKIISAVLIVAAVACASAAVPDLIENVAQACPSGVDDCNGVPTVAAPCDNPGCERSVPTVAAPCNSPDYERNAPTVAAPCDHPGCERSVPTVIAACDTPDCNRSTNYGVSILVK